jgi:1-acyl-sn-glycerol-3-phosphate acyltransferase
MDFIKKVMTPGHLLGKMGLQILDSVGLRKPLEVLVYQIEDPLINLWFSSSYNWKVFNEELVPPEGAGPIVFACNHQSIIDPWITGESIFHKSKRMPYQLTKYELGEDPLLGNYVSLNHVIYVKRGEKDESAIIRCLEVLKKEKGSILVYPEGTYGPGHGEFLPFKSGVIRIAYEGQSPIIPMASHGVDDIMGAEASRKFKAPASKGTLMVKFGKPISAESLIGSKIEGNAPTIDQYKEAAAKLQSIVHDLWEDLDKISKSQKH